MMSYTDAELAQLLSSHESDLVECKETFKGDAPNAVREAVCAFANDLPGHQRPGVVFIGVKDDGAPTGLAITDELLRHLSDIKTDGNIVPPPTLTVSKRRVKGAEMAVLIVQPADSPPVRYRGRIHVRTGPRRGTTTSQDERILNEKRRWRDAPFDVQPFSAAVLGDLNRLSFEEGYLKSAVAPDVLAANERSYEQRLAAAKMIATVEDPTPTVLGLLVLGNRPRDFLPGAYVQFLRIAGSTWSGQVIDSVLIDGTVGEILGRVEDKISSHNRVSVDFTTGPAEVRSQRYPMAALQQLLRNAIMHRTYESTNAPVHVYWFDDRIEIANPGGPYGVVTPDTFGKPGLVDYRNPNLAEALHVMGFVQRFGLGIATARRELEKNGSPPLEFEVNPNSVVAKIFARP